MAVARQNFSLIAGDDTDVAYRLAPPPYTFDLTLVDMSWTAYPQMRGVADKTQAVIVKTTADGSIVIDDPETYDFTVKLASADTMPLMGDLSGNYYYEIVIIDPPNNDRRSTPTIGTMTVIDTGDPTNVIAFKSMFPELETVPDAVLQTALDEAALFVDDTWAAQDMVAATYYLAGHFVVTAQAGSGQGGKQITSEHIGQISVTYAAAASAGTAYSSLGTTSYGLMFMALLDRNSAGIAII